MNIQTIKTDTTIFALLSQVINDITGIIKHESEITHVNLTGDRACEPVSYPDLEPLYHAHVQRGHEISIHSNTIFTWTR